MNIRSGYPLFFIHCVLFNQFATGCSSSAISVNASGPNGPIESSDADVTSESIDEATMNGQTLVADEPIQPIGYAKIPELTKEIRALNRKMLKLHRKGQYEKAVKGFTKVLELSKGLGGFPGARYNLACALAKLDRFEESTRHLKLLLRRDLPRFGRRIDEDEDLVDLRRSKIWPSILSHRTLMQKRWQEAMARGVAVVSNWKVDERWEQGDQITNYAQAGIYDHEWKRFVPMAPPVRMKTDFLSTSLLGAYFDRHEKQVVTIQAIGANADDFHICNLVIKIFRAGTGEILLTHKVPKTYIPSFDLAAFSDRIAYRDGWIHKKSPWYSIHGNKGKIPADGTPRYWFWGDQYMVYFRKAMPEDVQIKSNKIVTKESEYDVYYDPQSSCSNMVSDKSGRFIAISSTGYGTVSMEGFAISGSRAVLIDRKNKTIRRLGKGRHLISADFGEDGALYVQMHRKLRRYSPPENENFEMVMPHVVLIVNQIDEGFTEEEMREYFGQ